MKKQRNVQTFAHAARKIAESPSLPRRLLPDDAERVPS
jgi:hypothetical protein